MSESFSNLNLVLSTKVGSGGKKGKEKKIGIQITLPHSL